MTADEECPYAKELVTKRCSRSLTTSDVITLKRSKIIDIKSGSCMTFLVTSTTFRPDWPRSSLKTVPVMKKHGPPPSLEAPLISARSSQAVDMRQAVGLCKACWFEMNATTSDVITLKRSKIFDGKSGSCMTFLETCTTFLPDWPRSSMKTEVLASRVETKRRDLDRKDCDLKALKAKQMSDETLKKAHETMRSKRDIERRDHSEAIEDLRREVRVLYDLSGNLYDLSTRLAKELSEDGPCLPDEEARPPPSLEPPPTSARSSQPVGLRGCAVPHCKEKAVGVGLFCQECSSVMNDLNEVYGL